MPHETKNSRTNITAIRQELYTAQSFPECWQPHDRHDAYESYIADSIEHGGTEKTPLRYHDLDLQQTHFHLCRKTPCIPGTPESNQSAGLPAQTGVDSRSSMSLGLFDHIIDRSRSAIEVAATMIRTTWRYRISARIQESDSLRMGGLEDRLLMSATSVDAALLAATPTDGTDLAAAAVVDAPQVTVSPHPTEVAEIADLSFGLGTDDDPTGYHDPLAISQSLDADTESSRFDTDADSAVAISQDESIATAGWGLSLLEENTGAQDAVVTGTAGALLAADSDPAVRLTELVTAPATTDQTRRLEVLFVDTGVQDHQQLVNDLVAASDTDRQFEIVLLGRNRNGGDEFTDVTRYADTDRKSVV